MATNPPTSSPPDGSFSTYDRAGEPVVTGVPFEVAAAALHLAGASPWLADDDTGEQHVAKGKALAAQDTPFWHRVLDIQRVGVASGGASDGSSVHARVVPDSNAPILPKMAEKHWRVQLQYKDQKHLVGNPQQLAQAQVAAAHLLEHPSQWEHLLPPPSTKKPRSSAVRRERAADRREKAQADLDRRRAEGPVKRSPPAPDKPDGYALGEQVLIRSDAPGSTGEKYGGRTGRIVRISHGGLERADWNRHVDLEIDKRPRERKTRTITFAIANIRPLPPAEASPASVLGIQILTEDDLGIEISAEPADSGVPSALVVKRDGRLFVQLQDGTEKEVRGPGEALAFARKRGHSCSFDCAPDPESTARALLIASSGAAGAAGAPAREESLADFAARVWRAAQASPTGRWHNNKIFISHVWKEMERQGGAMPLPAFKTRLMEAHRAQLVELSRADLVQAMPPEDVAASETLYLNATFHFMRLEP